MNAVALALHRLSNPPPDRHVRSILVRSSLVHRERQNSGLMGLFTRCGRLWQTGDYDVTGDPVTCKTCLRAEP